MQRLFFSLFSLVIWLPYHVDRKMPVLFKIRPRLIIISFLMDKFLALGILFNEAHQTQEFECIRRRSFFFSHSVLCVVWLCNLDSSISQIMCLRSPTNKQQQPIFRSLKNYHVLTFWGLFLRTNHGQSASLCWHIQG